MVIIADSRTSYEPSSLFICCFVGRWYNNNHGQPRCVGATMIVETPVPYLVQCLDMLGDVLLPHGESYGEGLTRPRESLVIQVRSSHVPSLSNPGKGLAWPTTSHGTYPQRAH